MDHPRPWAAPTARQSPAAGRDRPDLTTCACALKATGRSGDTGIVNVFLKIGMQVRFDFAEGLEDVVNEAVRRAYSIRQQLRASVLDESTLAGRMKETRRP
jgi:fumarate hydratase class I